MLTVEQSDELKDYINNVLKKNLNDFHTYEMAFKGLSAPVQKEIVKRRFMMEVASLNGEKTMPNLLLDGKSLDNELMKIGENIFDEDCVEFYFGPTNPTFKQRYQKHLFENNMNDIIQGNNVTFEKGELSLNIKEYFSDLRRMYMNDDNRAFFVSPEKRDVEREKMFYESEMNKIVCVHALLRKMKFCFYLMQVERESNFIELFDVAYDMSKAYMEKLSQSIVNVGEKTLYMSNAVENNKEWKVVKHLEMLWNLSNEKENWSVKISDEMNQKQKDFLTILGNEVRECDLKNKELFIFSLLYSFNQSMKSNANDIKKPSKEVVSFLNEFVNYEMLENQYLVFKQRITNPVTGDYDEKELSIKDLKNMDELCEKSKSSSMWMSFNFNYLALAKGIVLNNSGVKPHPENNISNNWFGEESDEDKLDLMSCVYKNPNKNSTELANFKHLKDRMHIFLLFMKQAIHELNNDFNAKITYLENDNGSELSFYVKNQEDFDLIRSFIIKVLELNVYQDEIFKNKLLPVVDEYLMKKDVSNNESHVKSNKKLRKF